MFLAATILEIDLSAKLTYFNFWKSLDLQRRLLRQSVQISDELCPESIFRCSQRRQTIAKTILIHSSLICIMAMVRDIF